MSIVVAVCSVIWLYMLSVLHRAGLTFFKFLAGSVGLFILMMVTLQPLLTVPLSRLVAGGAGLFGEATGIFTVYPGYSLVFIQTSGAAISMYIDHECSGIIETLAYLALILFFPLYRPLEKAVVGAVGVVWIFTSNILRLLIICLLIYFFGDGIYYFAHAIFGRIVFYGFTIVLYFNVFTRAQIKRQRVGRFNFDTE